MEIQQQKVMDISHFFDYTLTLNIQGIKCAALPNKHIERGESTWFQVLTTHPTLDKYLDVDVCNQTTINKDCGLAKVTGHLILRIHVVDKFQSSMRYEIVQNFHLFSLSTTLFDVSTLTFVFDDVAKGKSINRLKVEKSFSLAYRSAISGLDAPLLLAELL